MKHIALLTALALTAGGLHAQSNDNTVIDRANQPGLPPERPAETGPTAAEVATETDSGDAGVQRLAEPRPLPFKLTVGADVQVYYTDNVLLATDSSASSNSDAVVVGSTLSLRGTGNPVTVGEGALTPSVALVYQNFRHGLGSDDTARDNLDFDAYSLPLTLGYRFGEGWEATAGLTASAVYRIHGAGDYKRIVASTTPSLGLRKIIPFSQTQVLVVGSSLSHSFTKATLDSVPGGFAAFRNDRNDKTDTSVDLTYYILKGDWAIAPYARFSYAKYDHYEEAGVGTATSVNRDDLTTSFGLSVSYKVNDRINARAFTNYEIRESDPAGAFDYSYKAGLVGLGVSLNITY